MKIKWCDIILFLVPIIIAIVSFFIIFNHQTKPVANIIIDGKLYKSIDLSNTTNQTIDLNLKYNNVIEIKDGKIRILNTDCPDKVCKNTGFINKAGQVIVCVPSKLIIKIEGKAEFDVVS